MKRAAILFPVDSILLFGIYLLLIGTTRSGERLAGAISACLAAVALAAVRRQGGAEFAFRAAWLAPAARSLRDAIRASAAMLVAVFREEGQFDAVEFTPGNDLPISNGRRALVIAGISLAPDSFVLWVDREKRRLILHRFGRLKIKQPDEEWPP